VLAVAEMETGIEIFGDATDEKRRIEAGRVKDPREHGSGGRFAVGPGDNKNFFAAEEFVMEQLRQRAEWQAVIQNVFEFDVAARDGVADDDKIGSRIEILRVEGLGDRNVELAEEIRHGRVSRGIGSGDAEATLLEHSSERGHGGSADADQVNVFGLVRQVISFAR
jgi:hypothetical protein